jgi:hypothetical protein
MNRTEIKEHLKSMAKKNCLYHAVLNNVNGLSKRGQESFWSELENKKFYSTVDLDIFIENKADDLLKPKKYFLYTGYYELIISDKELGRPYGYVSWHWVLENAFKAAERYDPDANLVFGTEEIRNRYFEYVGFINYEEMTEEQLKMYPILSA